MKKLFLLTVSVLLFSTAAYSDSKYTIALSPLTVPGVNYKVEQGKAVGWSGNHCKNNACIYRSIGDVPQNTLNLGIYKSASRADEKAIHVFYDAKGTLNVVYDHNTLSCKVIGKGTNHPVLFDCYY